MSRRLPIPFASSDNTRASRPQIPNGIQIHQPGVDGPVEIREQPGQSGAGVGQGIFTDNLDGGIEDADVMLTVTEIVAKGEPADDCGRGVGNEGRSGFYFQRQTLPDATWRRAICLLI